MALPSMFGLDFETYGATSLPARGLYNYMDCPTFRPLIASVTSYDPARNAVNYIDLDFVHGKTSTELLREAIASHDYIVAHNAPFEQQVLARMGIEVPGSRFIDSAVVARAMGAAGKLEAAAPQLLGTDKLASGWDLIKLFSMPGKYQEANGSQDFDPQITLDYADEWREFMRYCRLDSELGLRLVIENWYEVLEVEHKFNAITMDMNAVGWKVDVPKVEEMNRRYLENVEAIVEEFRTTHHAHDLNLNSLKQMKEWCLDRGIKANSFDEKNVAKLHGRISAKLDKADRGEISLDHDKYVQYCEVLSLLETKQALGGSSLKKLQTILDTTSKDSRLHDQYLHVGAGQTYRTTGKGVQMQNLKRLAETADMSTLDDLDSEWDNDQLAENIRQVFTATDENGALIVGDFASVESRGLAWLAGANWKVNAFRTGKDMYKVLAAKVNGIEYGAVTKEQRQFGKVGELSCGYNAGGQAVQAFAEKMGVELTEAEATKLVWDWRGANPEAVDLWERLHQALLDAMDNRNNVGRVDVGPMGGWRVLVYQTVTPASLAKQHPDATSLAVELVAPNGTIWLRRYFHGCYMRGKDIGYYKPSELKSGDLWKNHFTDPKTKQVRFYTIYGGKLTGILTQSFCREIFFRVLTDVNDWCSRYQGLRLVGQFHDEIVVDWSPHGGISKESAMNLLEEMMSDAQRHGINGFPLAAEVKYDYRYTK